MIVDPVLIIGAPRSGTSLLQKILRGQGEFWSMPSESDLVWDRYCHPELRGWDSEVLGAEDITSADRDAIRTLFERYMQPAGVWAPLEKSQLLWGFRRTPRLRKLMRAVFEHAVPLASAMTGRSRRKRLLEKTASNCFRLGYVNEVFPDARIVYPVRDGRNSISSLINAWRHPTRFFTYDVPVELNIRGCPQQRWKFVLPPGWRNYTTATLAEVCAFQWRSCHEYMLAETAKPQYAGRVYRLRLEDLTARPDAVLADLAAFLDIPYDGHLQEIATDLPVVNSPDNDVSAEKWCGENRALIEGILPSISPVMTRLGYEV